MYETKALDVHPGDVVLWCSGPPYRIEELRTVVKVTTTGRIRISDSDEQYDKYGRRMGPRSRYRDLSYIQVATKEDIKRMTENKTIDKAYGLMQRTKKENITYEVAVQIIKLLEAGCKQE